ncbi:MAG TPA: hypothetical protein VMD02_03315 [Candidatus Omnitrophota bacterium]|nr:hypothetical protein [Candidatus Omnitrophota bacterium]
MKKLIFVPLLVLALCLPVMAGTLNVSGRAGMYNPGGGSSPSVIYGVGADYDITPNVTVRGAVETTTYNLGGNSVTYMPVTADLIYNQTIAGIFTPYVGAGLSYNSYSSGGNSTSTTGYQAETGIKVSVGGFRAGIEYRYMIPDAAHSDQNTSDTSGYMEGSFGQSFNF